MLFMFWILSSHSLTVSVSLFFRIPYVQLRCFWCYFASMHWWNAIAFEKKEHTKVEWEIFPTVYNRSLFFGLVHCNVQEKLNIEWTNTDSCHSPCNLHIRQLHYESLWCNHYSHLKFILMLKFFWFRFVAYSNGHWTSDVKLNHQWPNWYVWWCWKRTKRTNAYPNYYLLFSISKMVFSIQHSKGSRIAVNYYYFRIFYPIVV